MPAKLSRATRCSCASGATAPKFRTRTLDVHVRRLRKKLGSYAYRYIETIFGICYRFQPFHAPRFFNAVVNPPLAIGA